jgi:hypothetical protein
VSDGYLWLRNSESPAENPTVDDRTLKPTVCGESTRDDLISSQISAPELKHTRDPRISNFSSDERPDCTGYLHMAGWIGIAHEGMKTDGCVSREIAHAQLGKFETHGLPALVLGAIWSTAPFAKSSVTVVLIIASACFRTGGGTWAGM